MSRRYYDDISKEIWANTLMHDIFHALGAQGAKDPKNPAFKPLKPSCAGTNEGGPTSNDWRAVEQLTCQGDDQQGDNTNIQPDTNDDDCICDDASSEDSDYDDSLFDYSSEEYDESEDESEQSDESLKKLTTECVDGISIG